MCSHSYWHGGMGKTAVTTHSAGVDHQKDREIATQQQRHWAVGFDAVYMSIVGKLNSQQNVHDDQLLYSIGMHVWICNSLVKFCFFSSFGAWKQTEMEI